MDDQCRTPGPSQFLPYQQWRRGGLGADISPTADVGATRKWVVAPVAQTYYLKEGIEVVDVMTAIQRVAAQNQRNE